MTAPKPLNPGIAARIEAEADHARRTTCLRCGAPILTARAGRVAALDVRADPEPVDAIGELLARLSGRLTWHLIAIPVLGYQRITWRHLEHIHAGPKPGRLVIADHTCPPQPVQERLM